MSKKFKEDKEGYIKIGKGEKLEKEEFVHSCHAHKGDIRLIKGKIYVCTEFRGNSLGYSCSIWSPLDSRLFSPV